MSSQRSISWYRDRTGRFCGSEVGALMTKAKEKNKIFGKTAMAYIYKVASERNLKDVVLNDDVNFDEYLKTVNSFVSREMQFGIEMEEVAREVFCNKRLVSMEEVGSCVHPKYDYWASSPDGIFYEDGKKFVWENKTPSPKVFMEYMDLVHTWEDIKRINSDYFWQLNSEIACCDADGAVFCIFNPFMREPMHTIELERVDEYIEQLEERVVLANELVNQIVFGRNE